MRLIYSKANSSPHTHPSHNTPQHPAQTHHKYVFILETLYEKRKSIVLKVHKIENFFDSDFGICVISLLVMSKY
jgi:hypothetical protein